MSLPEIVSRDQWLAARRELLRGEKALTQARDALNADRRRLPMVPVDKPYTFGGPHGLASLVDLFEGRRQLMVQHFMFDPSWDEGCPSCSAAADEMSAGLQAHLHARGTTFAVVSRAPMAKIQTYKDRKGWTFPWYSSYGSEFNYDFHVTIDESVIPLEVNYRTRPDLERAADDSLRWLLETEQPFELPGISCFLREGDQVFHTYSTFARGSEALGGGYAFLDLTALGRQESWEEPRGRVDNPRGPMPDFAV